MLLTLCKGKIHRARVTEARLDYTGSITLGPELMAAAGILPFEMVHVNSMSTACHWETYAIPGNPGQVCLNGCPARLFMVGDEVIILSLGMFTPNEAARVKQALVFVNQENQIVEVKCP